MNLKEMNKEINKRIEKNTLLDDGCAACAKRCELCDVVMIFWMEERGQSNMVSVMTSGHELLWWWRHGQAHSWWGDAVERLRNVRQASEVVIARLG